VLDDYAVTCYIFPMSLIFLKLGGSLITDKTRPYTPRLEKLDAIAVQIAAVLHENADLRLVLGHGSGSFGHTAASQFDTRHGVSGQSAWHGFAEVWYQASALNRLVLEALRRAKVPAITISPAASVTAHDGKILVWDQYPIKSALSNGLVPIIHGDAVFDDFLGGTILSTEDLFAHLALGLHPDRILLAGLEEGVWANFPERKRLFKEITPGELTKQVKGLKGSEGVDVTGGMLSKVTEMLLLVEKVPGLEVSIFSGEGPDNVRAALLGQNQGTRLHR
jgi:isopentenyl phosphate kinase